METPKTSQTPYQAPSEPTGMRTGTMAMGFLGFATGGFSLISIVLFAYQVQCIDPATCLPFRETPHSWVHLAGHIIRIAMFGAVFLAIRQHWASAKCFSPENSESIRTFMRTHDLVWFRIALLVFVMLAYGIFNVAYLSYYAFYASPYKREASLNLDYERDYALVVFSNSWSERYRVPTMIGTHEKRPAVL